MSSAAGTSEAITIRKATYYDHYDNGQVIVNSDVTSTCTKYYDRSTNTNAPISNSSTNGDPTHSCITVSANSTTEIKHVGWAILRVLFNGVSSFTCKEIKQQGTSLPANGYNILVRPSTDTGTTSGNNVTTPVLSFYNSSNEFMGSGHGRVGK